MEHESRVLEFWRGNGRTGSTMQVYLCWVRRFYRYCDGRHRDPVTHLTLDGAREFARGYARERGIDEQQTFACARSALRAWSIAVRTLGGSPPSWRRPAPPPRWRPILREYCRFRQHHRGVAASSLCGEVKYIAQFLALLGAAGRPVSRIRLIDIDAFVVRLRTRCTPRTIAGVCSTLRAFLRFLTATGRLRHDLACSVAAPIAPRRDRPPRALAWCDVRRILAAVDLRVRAGHRDRTLFLLMAAYGMGAAEVRALCLDDIDWRAATLRVTRPKTGTSIVLPLLPQLARALVQYLRFGRPRHAQSRALFLSACAPHGPVSGSAVRHAFRKHAQTAGVDVHHLGPHALRHSHATRQIDLGAPPKIVGDILGHRDPASTSAYVHVASRRLRPLALPVPR